MGLPTLNQEFPVMRCLPVAADNEYPALDWVRWAAKNMCFRFTEMQGIIRDRINFSRYSYIPVCNLEDDAPVAIIDTIYARTLAMSK
jgi:Domain of unknown function (DUF1744)